MAGFDELIERLLNEIACVGSQGFSAHQFEKTVRNYYDEKNAEATTNDNPSDDDLLFSSAPPARKTSVDDELLESILTWLCKHPDVNINDANGSQSTSSALNVKLAGKRIFTTEDRVWQAITGHGIDHRRVPMREFEILSVVAAHGSTGVLQPHVTKLTGQDKRSVPKRTDMLVDKGYIVKENVIGAGARTSNLKLKRYANVQPLEPMRIPEFLAGSSSEAAPTVIYYNAWFNTTIRLLKENDNILTIEDLRLHLGLNPKKYENKILRRSIKRLSESGCIRCISAKLHDADGNSLIHLASGREKKALSIQLLREPTDFDRMKWAQGNSKAKKDNGALDDDFDDLDDAAQADKAESVEEEDDFDDLELLKERIPPQWTPDVPLINLVYSLVEEAGPEGISSMEIANRLTGPIWRRPLDQVMLLLTDVWQQSQPPHLRHLAIVRDTSVHGKLVHFQFKTYGNFERAVESGDASWEAVQDSEKAKGKKKANDRQPGLDEWGFPLIPSKELASGDGNTAELQRRRNFTKGDLTSDEASEDVADTIDSPKEVESEGVARERSLQLVPQVAEPDGGAQAADDTQHGLLASASAQPEQKTSAKRRGPYKRRTDPARPGVPLVKTREIPQHEFDEWEATVERTAQLKVMFEMNASQRRGINQAGHDDATDAIHVTVEDLPLARVEQVKEDLMTRDKPGIYINPPGAREKKRQTFVSRGRPRTALIAVVKTQNLHELEWFQDDSTPRFAPVKKRRRTAKIGLMPAEAKSPEYVDSDSDVDETVPKRPRVDASGLATSALDVSNDAPASTVRARPNGDASASTSSTMLPAISSPAKADLQEATPSVRRNNNTPKRREKTLVPVAPAPDFDDPTTAVDNQNESSTAAVQESLLVHSTPSPGKDTNVDGISGASAVTTANIPSARQQSAAEELNALKSKRGRKSKEVNARVAELEKQILQGHSDPVEQYNILKSRPGQRSRETRTLMAQLQKQIERQQENQKTPQKVIETARPPSNGRHTHDATAMTQSTTIPSTDRSASTTNPQPPSEHPEASQQSGSGNFTAANGQLFETFNKEYVLAHPTEMFHHRGAGRYARGAKPATAITSRATPGDVAKGSVQAGHQAATITVGATSEKPQADNSNPEQSSRLEQTAIPVQSVEISLHKEADDTGPTQSTDTQQIGLSEEEISNRVEQTATSVPDLEAHVEEEPEVNGPMQSSDAQQTSSTARFDATYVETHPEETFYHRGKGVWALGLPPPGYSAKVGVRGPGAEDWRASIGMPTKAPKTPAPLKEKLATTAMLRRSARNDHGAADGAVTDETARTSLMVKLPIPRSHLTALASKDNKRTVRQALADNGIASGSAAPLPTSRQSTITRPNADTEHSPFKDSSHARTQDGGNQPWNLAQASSNSSPSILRIVRPYDASAQQRISPSVLDSLKPGPAGIEATQLTPTTSVRQAEDGPPTFQTQNHGDNTQHEEYVPIVEDSMDVDQQPDEEESLSITPAVPVQFTANSPKSAKKLGTTRTRGSVVFQRQKIILDALRACNGVFPGDVEMWYVFANAWKRIYNQAPDKQTVDNTLKTLQQSKKLKKLLFQFQGKSGSVVQRAILTEPNIDPTSVQVKKMQKRIIDCYPSFYLPSEVEVDAEVRARIARALEKKQDAHADANDLMPTSTPTKRDTLNVSKEPAVVRQTQRSTDVEAKQAKQQGFPDVFSFRQHLLDEVEAKKSASSAQFQIQQREKAGWADNDNEERAGGDQTTVPRPPPKLPIPALQRKPLSSLRPNTRSRNKPHRPRDVGGGMTLEDEARYRLRAANLIHYPTQEFHKATGTFNTCPVVSVHTMPELRMLRSRPVILGECKQNRLLATSSNVPFGLVETLSRACSSPQTDKAREFFQEVDAVETWEKQLEEHAEVSGSRGTVFINHTLNQPHALIELEQLFGSTTMPPLMVPAPTSPSASGETQNRQPASLRAQTLITPEMSRKTGKAKRQYSSRKNKNVNFEDAAQDSETEYVPDDVFPARRTARVRADGKEIASRDRKSGAEFKESQRLIISVALVTTLCGGLHSDRPPWTAVAHAMGFYHDANFYRRRWDCFKRYRQGELDELRSRIRENFPTAYERNELPSINFQDLCNTDWPALVRWVEETILPHVETTEQQQAPHLLPSREAVEDEFIVQEQKPIFRFSADEYFTNLTETGRKHYALRYTHGIPLASPSADGVDDMVVLKSWVRAVIMTKQWNYNPDVAAAKLSTSFSSSMLEKVTAEMVQGRMFTQEKKGRQLPGRNFVIHNDVLAQFKRWPAKPEEYQYLRAVSNAWANIVQHFETNEELNLVAEASDPEYIVLTNMAAQGQIKPMAMLPPRKDDYDASFPKLSPWGYSGYSYETKKVNPSLLKAPIVYKKSTIYRAHHGLTVAVPIPLQLATRAGETGARIPFWVDIHGNLIEDVWDMVVRSLVHLLVFRSGLTAARMEECHGHKFWDWEIELALVWLEKTGIAVRTGDGVEEDGIWKGGWSAGQWWYCAFAPDVATWQAPSDAEIGIQTAA
ncbi:hypothetical protein M409DRAFT_24549 [Zasmidium cellare ATCC 36951]|uniref:Uncharacterized protein n=1 Tax=Zasmidium cellare ATCC 36951 TaxID=1080233 RepID=A0A6A6CEQ5_ZASCE|nr:uncharacterized protein M409DRAFT_24549 [Zasmidium cellare ATCC 36951]KAF2165163.1 hypothetical protein M409DRAFT_24549 [Zasmidium cellare ATCC 36951]